MYHPVFIVLRWVFSFRVKYLIKRYKRLMIQNSHRQGSVPMLLLKAKIHYWKCAYDWWGWLMNGRFSYGLNEGKKHEAMMKRIGFRDKVKEWDIIKCYWPNPVLGK